MYQYDIATDAVRRVAQRDVRKHEKPTQHGGEAGVVVGAVAVKEFDRALAEAAKE